MWVEVLLFLVAAATAAYLYLTRHVGWFKARGVCEHDYSFPCGTPELTFPSLEIWLLVIIACVQSVR